MIPEPLAMKIRPTFGDLSSIYIGNIYHDAGEAENLARLRVNNYITTFFLKKKKVFTLQTGNMETAHNIAIRMLKYKDKNWKFDDVEYKRIKQ